MITFDIQQSLHNLDANGVAKSPNDYKICEYLKEQTHMFVYRGSVYVYFHGVYCRDPEGKIAKTLIKECLFEKFRNYNYIQRIYNLLLVDYYLEVGFDDLNCFPEREKGIRNSLLVNFQNGFFNPYENRIIPHDPIYRSVNQIPCEYHPDAKPTGKEIDKLFRFLGFAKDDIKMLFQFCGLSFTVDTRWQKFLMLYGAGGGGKSVLLSLLGDVLGQNMTCVKMENIGKRFSFADLAGYTLNSAGEASVNAFMDLETIKQLTGEDPVECEEKFKSSYKTKLYNKFIFSCNNLPHIARENTGAIYRRFLILNFDKTPQKKDVYLADRLIAEKDYFIHLCMQGLREIAQSGEILESKRSRETVSELQNNCDSVQAWLNDCTEQGDNKRTERKEAYTSYMRYCTDEGRGVLKKSEFYNSLKDKRYNLIKTDKGTVRSYVGFALREEDLEID